MVKRRRSPPSKMADIARLAGVHTSTVSRALAGSPLVAREQRERILKLARERGYVINTSASNLRRRRTQTISVAIPLGHEAGQALTDPFFMEILGHLADEITQRGYGMFLQKILPPMDDWLPRLIASRRSDGIIIVGQSTEHAAIQSAAASYQPMVVWGGHLAHQSYCSVGTDNMGGGRVVVEHLIRAGRRRIVFLGDPAVPEFKLRLEGYRHALSHATGCGRERVVPAHLTADAAYEAMRAFIRRGGQFDAVFGATDIIAMSAIRAITAAGLTVPRDVSVAGFDDIAISAHFNPPLTTMRQDIARGARMLVELLFRRLNGEDTPSATMPAELIVRESSVPSATPSNAVST
jgi:DNA-binding LacI/PurR family transcriptional regulator